jgi:serine/threonine-protein kinase
MAIEMPADFARGPVGQVIAGRYRITSVIGGGAQGLVCRAEDAETGSHVAIKLINGAADQQAVARFVRECDVLRALERCNVVRILETLSENRTLYLVMELLEGKDLEQLLEQAEQQGNRLSPREMFRLLEPIVDTLDAAHARGIFHRDLKPANIFVQRSGGVRLLDFGLCRLVTAKPLTELGTVLGSPSYIAPEAWRGKPHLVNSSADVYALGVIMFRMLSGRLPFAAQEMSELLRLVTMAERPSLAALVPALPAEVDDWVEQALAIRPEARFRSVRALYNALLSIVEPAPIKSARSSWIVRALHKLARFRRRDEQGTAAAWKAAVRAVQDKDPVDELLRQSYRERSRRR